MIKHFFYIRNRLFHIVIIVICSLFSHTLWAETYNVTVTTSGNGKVSCNWIATLQDESNVFSVDKYSSFVAILEPGSGYRIGMVDVDGKDVTYDVRTNDSRLILEGIVKDININIIFERIPEKTYTVTLTCKGNGTGSLSGPGFLNTGVHNQSYSCTCHEGDYAIFGFGATKGCIIRKIVIDGQEVDLGTNKIDNYKYEVKSVNRNINVEVTFAEPVFLSIWAEGNGAVLYEGESIREKSIQFNCHEGDEVEVSFIPDEGAHIKRVSLGNVDITSEVKNNKYRTVLNFGATIHVEFEAKSEYTPVTTTYTLSVSASGSGSATYGGTSVRNTTSSFTLNEGTSATISFSPDDGYRIASITVNGSSMGAVSSVTVIMNSNTTVAVVFEAKPDDTPVTPTYTLSISASGSGSASYDGTTIRSTIKSFTLNEGTSATISFSPDDGYRIASVTVNGSNMGSNSSVAVTMNSNKTVSVVFEEIPIVTYDMTITAKGDGEASYNGSSVRDGTRTFKVNEGSNPRVTFSPDLGNRTKSVKLNGSDVSFSDNRYTISNVRGNNKLVVEFEELESKFTSDGFNYEVSSFEKMTVKIGMGDLGLFIEVPEKVKNQEVDYKVEGITDEAMNANKELAAIIWNPENTINFKNSNPNLLIYIKDAKYAPKGINNIVVGETAENIVLTDAQSGNNFYCPKAFTAKQITYAHRYRMRTGAGESSGWESIALPFDVQKIEHAEEGEIIPFAKWTSSKTTKPFWLYQLGTTGYVEAEGIKAYTPYIISMPNNEVYQDEYIIKGTISFSSTNVEVKKSDDVVKAKYGDRTFIPNFINLENNAGYYALNVNNDVEAYQGSEKEGSVFIQNLRRIHPFESYMTSTSGTRSIGIFDGMTTAIRGIEEIDNGQQTLKVYNLNGQCIKTGSSMDELKQELPSGLYIINNKKIIVR